MNDRKKTAGSNDSSQSDPEKIFPIEKIKSRLIECLPEANGHAHEHGAREHHVVDPMK